MFVVCQVHFIPRDDLRAFGKFGVEFDQFFVDFFKILYRVAPLAARNIHHMHKHSAALHMAQKFMPQSDALCRALDQSGNIRHHKALFRSHGNHTQNGGNRGEVVIADNRFCFAHDGNQRGFADIREA